MVEGLREPIVAVFEETWSATAKVCEGLPVDAWELPTDCPGWTVRDQLSHLIGTERGLLGEGAPPPPDPMPDYVHNPIGALNEAWIEARRGVPGDQVLAEFVAVTTRRLEELAGFPTERWELIGWSPMGDTPYREFMKIRAFDSWVHGQDVRRAIDRPGERFGIGEANTMDRVALGMPFVVGRKVAPPDQTTVVFEVDGPLARTIAIKVEGKRAAIVDDLPPVPSVRIILSPDRFIGLGCGREAPEVVLDSHQVRFEGDDALGARVIRAMDFMI
jgi:uncharacterized protein (TIGR03083 family)